jgi:hypothetical protein
MGGSGARALFRSKESLMGSQTGLVLACGACQEGSGQRDLRARWAGTGAASERAGGARSIARRATHFEPTVDPCESPKKRRGARAISTKNSGNPRCLDRRRSTRRYGAAAKAAAAAAGAAAAASRARARPRRPPGAPSPLAWLGLQSGKRMVQCHGNQGPRVARTHWIELHGQLFVLAADSGLASGGGGGVGPNAGRAWTSFTNPRTVAPPPRSPRHPLSVL